MDAWIVIILLFAVSFGFNFYQRYEYSDLLNDHVQLQASTLRMEYAISFMEVSLDHCKNGNVVDH